MAISQGKTNITFYLILGIFIVFIFLLGILLFNIAPIFIHMYHTVITGANPDCDCIHHVPLLTNHPYISTFILFLGLLTTIFLFFIIYNLIKSLLVTKKYINQVVGNKVELMPKLYHVAISLGLNNKVVAVNSNSLDIFCFGFLKPKICISSRLINQVSKKQLKAILLHEKNHLKSYDPLKLFLVNAIRKSLFFIPGLNHLASQFEIGLELAADERATNNLKETQSLSKALIKIIDLDQTLNHRVNHDVAVTFLSVTEARIDRLIDSHYKPRFKWFTPKLVMSFVVIIGLSVLFFNTQAILAKTTEINHPASSLDSVSCPMEISAMEKSNSYCSYEVNSEMAHAPYSESNSCN